jgi:ribose transport system substrate-binding protein
MFKKFVPVLLLVVLFVTIAGNAIAADKPKIYFIVKATESSFWQIVIDGGQTAAAKLGVDMIAEAAPSEADIAKQISIVEAAIAAKPAAIALAPTVADALVPAIEKATAAKIPVILFDSAAKTEQYVSFLASDNIKIGTTGADKLAEALIAKTGKAEGEVVALSFMAGVGSLEARKKGFLDQIAAKYPGIKVVDFFDAQGQQGKSLAAVQNYLITYPDLKGIFASNEPTGEETVRALDTVKKTGLAVVVVDSGPQEQWGLANGYVDSMIVQMPWKMGYMALEYALKAANGEKLEKFIDTGIAAISPAMQKDGSAEEFLNPVEFHKKNAK